MKLLRFILVVVAVGYIVYFLETAVKPTLLKGRYQLIHGKVMEIGADPNYQFERPVCFKLDTETGDIWLYHEAYWGKKLSIVQYFRYIETLTPHYRPPKTPKWQEAPIVEQSKDIFDEISSAEKKDSNDPEQKTKRIRFIPDDP